MQPFLLNSKNLLVYIAFMLQKIVDAVKYLSQGKNEAKEIKKSIEDIKITLDTLDDQIKETEKKFNFLESKILGRENFLKQSTKALQELIKLSDNMRKELIEIKLKKDNLDSIIKAEFSSIIDKNLIPEIQIVNKEIKEFLRTKNMLSEIVAEINNLKGEMVKIQRLTKKISEKDLEFQKTIKFVKELEREKIRLLEENSRLRSIISTERRKNRRLH